MRIALTGGATGIGAEVAALMRQNGHEITAFDITKPTANVDHWIETDLSDPTSIATAVDQVDGPYDALINNAGLPPRDGLEELVLNVNFIGFRQFLNAMLDKMSEGASIVNVASRAGAHWRDNLDEVKGLIALQNRNELSDFIAARNIDHVRAYNLSKEAIIVLTQAMTEDMVAHGLRMNSVSPAAVSTGILDEFVAAFGEKVARNIKRAGRPGTAQEIAEVISFLASPQSHWIKGQDLVIDGGMSAMAISDALNLNEQER